MDSYNSKYPVEYYEIGTPYMFYISNPPKNAVAADIEHIKKYAPILKLTSYQPGYKTRNVTRAVGVVVGKEKKPTGDSIEVLFQGDSSGETVYMTAKYIVGYTGVFYDDMESYEAAGVVDLNEEIKLECPPIKNGGIKLDTEQRNGGIKLDIDHKSGGIKLDT